LGLLHHTWVFFRKERVSLGTQKINEEIENLVQKKFQEDIKTLKTIGRPKYCQGKPAVTNTEGALETSIEKKSKTIL